MAQAPCLGKKHIEKQIANCKQESGEIRKQSQGRPLACRQRPHDTAAGFPRCPGPHFHWGIRRVVGGAAATSTTQSQTPHQSQGQRLLQDDRQSLLSRLSSPRRPHPGLIQQAEGREEQRKVKRESRGGTDGLRQHCGAGRRQGEQGEG